MRSLFVAMYFLCCSCSDKEVYCEGQEIVVEGVRYQPISVFKNLRIQLSDGNGYIEFSVDENLIGKRVFIQPSPEKWYIEFYVDGNLVVFENSGTYPYNGGWFIITDKHIKWGIHGYSSDSFTSWGTVIK